MNAPKARHARRPGDRIASLHARVGEDIARSQAQRGDTAPLRGRHHYAGAQRAIDVLTRIYRRNPTWTGWKGPQTTTPTPTVRPAAPLVRAS